LRATLDVGRSLATPPANVRVVAPVAVGLAALIALATVTAPVLRADLGCRDTGGWLLVVARIINDWGDGWSVVGLGAALFLAGSLGGRPRAVEAALALAAGGVWCFALTQLGQFVLAEDRPIHGGAMHFFARHGHGVSGHASGAALLFWPLLHLTRGRSRWVRVALATILAGWALLVGETRICLAMHDAWNVLVGYVIGEEMGRLGVRSLRTSLKVGSA